MSRIAPQFESAEELPRATPRRFTARGLTPILDRVLEVPERGAYQAVMDSLTAGCGWAPSLVEPIARCVATSTVSGSFVTGLFRVDWRHQQRGEAFEVRIEIKAYRNRR